MENASKALLIAAGVLIGILILSLAVYLFATFGGTSAEVNKQNAANQIAQFNSQFTSYEGKDDITIYNIATVANLAKENNSYYELTTNETGNYYIVVKIGQRQIEGENYNDIIERIKNESLINNELPIYTCKTEISPTTQRVKIVTFNVK